MSNATDISFQDDAYDRPLHPFSGHTSPIRTMAYLPDGKRLVTGSDDKTIRVWTVADGRQEGTEFVHAASVFRLAVTNDGTKIFSGDIDGRMTVWNVATHELIEEWQLAEKYPRVCISPDDRLVAYGTGSIVIREVNGGRIRQKIWAGAVFSLCFSHDASKIACGLVGEILIHNINNGKKIYTLKGHQRTVSSLQWSHDGTRIYSGCWDKTIRCWDADTGKQIGEPWKGHTDDINSFSLSVDGTKLASASDDGTVRLWDSFGHPIGHTLQHNRPVIAVCISPLDDFVAAAGFKLTVWKLPWSDENQSDVTTMLPASSIPSTITSQLVHTQVPEITLNTKNKLDIHKSQAPRGSHNVETRLVTQPSVLGDPSSQARTSPSIPPADAQKASHTIDGGLQCHSDLLTVDEDVERSIAPPQSKRQDLTLPLVPLSRQDENELKSLPVPPNLTPHIVKIDEQYREIGGFGDVYKCIYNSPTGAKEVAVKAFRFVFTLEDGGAKVSKMARRELGIWKRLEHPNIVPFLGIATGFGLKGSTSVVSLWMTNGSLHKFLESHGDQLDPAHRLQLLLDVSKGLDYLHTFPNTPVIHGDLNCNNVLIDGDLTARLCDFGLSSFVGNIPQGLTYLGGSTVRPGTLRWTAPEQLEDGYERTFKSDIYSFGYISLQVFSGTQPWEDVREDAGVILRLARGQKHKRPLSRAMEDCHWEFIERCWRAVEERPTARILVASLQELLSSCAPSRSLHDAFASLSVSNPIDRVPSSVQMDVLSSPPIMPSVSDVAGEGREEQQGSLIARVAHIEPREPADNVGRAESPANDDDEREVKFRFSSLFWWMR